MSNSPKLMSWQDKLESAKKIMIMLENVKHENTERDVVDILELSAKLLLPSCHVRLSFELF
jgi:hypothetical protein